MTDDRRTIERLEAEVASLRAERDLLRDVLDALPDVVVASRAVRDEAGAIVDGEVRFANAALRKTTGHAPDDAVGRRISALFPSDLENGLFEAYVEAVRTGHVMQRDVYFAAGPDEAHWYGVKVAPLDDGWVATGWDIQGRKEAELALARERALLAGILENAPIILSFVDRDLVWQWVNQRAAEVLGMPAERLVGRTLAEAFGADAAARFDPLRRRVIDTGEPVSHRESPLVYEVDGERRETFWDLDYLPVRVGGEIVGMLSVGHEVSERVAQRRRDRALIEALAEEQAKLAQIIEHAPVAIAYFDDDMVFQVANPTFYQMTTRRPETVIGRTYAQVFPEAPPGVEEALFRVLRQGEVFTEVAFPFPLEVEGGGVRQTFWDFTYMQVPGHGGAGPSGMLVICSDVTERVERERVTGEQIRALQAQEALLKGVLDSALDGVLVWRVVRDEGGRAVDATCVLANPAASRVAQRTPDRLVGHRMSEMFPGNFRSGLFENYVRVAETGEPFETEHRYIDPPEPGRWLSIKAAKVGDGFAVTVADIGARKATEAALEAARALRELEARRTISELERADRLKDEFLGVVSHELRTPVHILMGYMRILLQDRSEPLPARQRGFVEKAARKVEDLAGIVNAVLDFSQISAGTLRLVPEDVDVGAFLHDLAGPLVDLATGKGLAMTIAIPDGLPVTRLDPLRVRQALTNLVGNAIKFTAPGGRVHLAAERRGSWLRVEVTDTGIGIAPDQQARIFERFIQADMALTRQAGGVGLGLAIAKQLVEAHGGTIGVASVPGEGSTFWVELPLDGVGGG